MDTNELIQQVRKMNYDYFLFFNKLVDDERILNYFQSESMSMTSSRKKYSMFSYPMCIKFYVSDTDPSLPGKAHYALDFTQLPDKLVVRTDKGGREPINTSIMEIDLDTNSDAEDVFDAAEILMNDFLSHIGAKSANEFSQSDKDLRRQTKAFEDLFDSYDDITTTLHDLPRDKDSMFSNEMKINFKFWGDTRRETFLTGTMQFDTANKVINVDSYSRNVDFPDEVQIKVKDGNYLKATKDILDTIINS